MATPGSGSRVAQAGEQVRAGAYDGAQRVRSVLDYELIPFEGLSLTVGGLIAAAVILAAAWFGSSLLRRALSRYGARHSGINNASLYAISRVLHYSLLALGVVMALDIAGIPVSRFAVFAGALGVGLGFGLQAIFSNFVSGLILLFDKSLKVGDFVELDADVRGTVREINIRATRVTTNDNIDILVPNSEFVTGRVVNWTLREARRRLRVEFSAAYGVDKELVKKAALEAAARVPFTLSMEGPNRPQVWLVNFGDSAVEYILAVWLTEEATKRNAAIKAAYLWELDTAFKAHGIEIPFPQRDLNLRSVFGLEGDEALALLRGRQGSAGSAPTAPSHAREPTRLAPQEHAALSTNDAQLDAGQAPEAPGPDGSRTMAVDPPDGDAPDRTRDL